jgi:hypothetical protein
MGIITHAEIVRVDFSPSDMGGAVVLPRIPSSQPVQQRQVDSVRDAQSLMEGNRPLITRPTPI